MLDNTPDIIDDIRIREIKALNSPAEIMREFPRTDTSTRTVSRARQAVQRIVHGDDDRLAVVIGPCSNPRPRGRDGIRRPSGRPASPP